MTQQEIEELVVLKQLMSRTGRFDNYEPFPDDVRRYHELQARVLEGPGKPQ